MDFNDMAKIVSDQNWKFTQMIIGLSIGIVAFSIQTLLNNVIYVYLWLLFSSWAFFIFALIIGFIRLHHIQSVTMRNASEFYNTQIKHQQYKPDEKRYFQTNRTSAILYRVMLLSFSLGIISFAIFKIINLKIN